MITWQCLTFDQLSTFQLYQLLQLRVNVFVVEQTCPYPELDNKDHAPGACHLLGYQGEQLVACARLLPPGVSYDNASIGRVATLQSARGNGLGHDLLSQALTHCQQLWPQQAIEISAQAHLQAFYRQHGFARTTEVYLEDDIEHVGMLRSV